MRRISLLLVLSGATLVLSVFVGTAAYGAHHRHHRGTATTTQSEGAGTGPEYPPCSPYLSEGAGSICRLQNLRIEARTGFQKEACQWTKATIDCEGRGLSGPFPWTNGGGVSWKPNGNGRTLSLTSYSGGTRLVGTLPAPDSPRFTVTDARADGGELPLDQADNFYTPNLPGQAPGEVGGPLEFRAKDYTDPFRVELTFNGYLYLG